jgi:hypothetical protein
MKKHGREVGGGFGLVHDIFWREEKPWVVLKLPMGRRLTIPADLTDLPPKMFSTLKERTEVHAPMLLEVAKLCRQLLLTRSRGRAMRKSSTRPTKR